MVIKKSRRFYSKKNMHNIQKNKILLPIMVAICIIAIAVMIFALTTKAPKFLPPAFDSAAVKGTPTVSDDLGYTKLEAEPGYVLYACGKLAVTNDSVDIYLTSPDTNTVWVRAQLLDRDENVIGETGVIKPGEYVQSLILNKIPQASEDVTIKIIGYEPDTWKSMGNINLNTKLVVNS